MLQICFNRPFGPVIDPWRILDMQHFLQAYEFDDVANARPLPQPDKLKAPVAGIVISPSPAVGYFLRSFARPPPVPSASRARVFVSSNQSIIAIALNPRPRVSQAHSAGAEDPRASGKSKTILHCASTNAQCPRRHRSGRKSAQHRWGMPRCPLADDSAHTVASTVCFSGLSSVDCGCAVITAHRSVTP